MKWLWRNLYRVYRVMSSLRYWGRRRLTWVGFGVLVAVVVMGMLGTDTENTVAYQGFALLVFLLLVSSVFSLRFKLRYVATRLLPRFATAGQPFTYRVRLRSSGRRPLRGLTLLENVADPRPAFSDWRAQQIAESKRTRSFRVSKRSRGNPYQMAQVKEVLVPATPAGQEAEARMELTPLRRGVLRLEGVALARPDPLGLFRALATVSLPETVLVLPKRYPLPPIALPGSMKYQEGGVALASNVGRSEEFVALRDYRYGDPLRHIHWRSWAKVGKPIVREFEDEFFVRHALVLDTFTDLPHSDVFEEAVSLAASFACTIPSQESLLDLLFVGAEAYRFTAGRGLGQSAHLLEVLAGVQPCADKPFTTLEPLVLNHMSAVSGCICVFVGWDRDRMEFVQKLKAVGVPVMVLVVVPAGAETMLGAGPMRDDPARFHVLEAGQMEKGLSRL